MSLQHLPRPRLEHILSACHNLRIGVVGDFTLDGYWYADMTRSQLSRETPLYPRPIVSESYSCGGAANVAWNLATLGVKEVRAFSFFGSDWRGQILTRELTQSGVTCSSIQTIPDWITPFYGKVVLTNGELRQEDSRVDFVNTHLPDADAVAALLQEIEKHLPKLNAVVIADYQQFGVLTSDVIRALNRLAEANPQVVFMVDSRDRITEYHNMVLKPNQVEASVYFFPDRSPAELGMDELVEAASAFQQKQQRPFFMTLGERGCLVVDAFGPDSLPSIPLSGPIDPVGAGDTFLSAASAALASGATPREAGMFANLASSVTIQKLGVTGAAAPDEILDAFDSQM